MLLDKYSKEELRHLQWSKSSFLWAADNHFTNEKQEDLEFKQHAFLKDVYDDFSQVIVARKASQVGFSVMKIIKSFWASAYRKYNIIYTLPTFQDVNQFVPSKVNVLIQNNPMLRELTQDKDTTFQKKVGNGFIYYRGTFSKRSEKEKSEAGIGIILSSDLNIYDECDRSDQKILEQYDSRLTASKYGGRWYFSNPSTPYTKSQGLWEISDQKHWFIKCEHCNEWQYLDFFKNIKDNKFVCIKCGGEISDEVRKSGKWVKKYRNKDISGYWISHAICPWVKASQMVEAEQTKSKEYFYNFILGLPYAGTEVTVNQDVIMRDIDDTEPNYQKGNVMGIDQGLRKYYVIGNRQGIFKIGTTNTWEEIEDIWKIYDVGTVVIDALPDLTEPRKLREKYPGKIWLNYYKREMKKADFIDWDDKTHTVYTDRTKIIGMVIDELVNRKIRFQMKSFELVDIVRHYKTLYKQVVQDSMGIEQEIWESGGEDHFVHAMNYFRVALEKAGDAEITDWKKETKVYDGTAPIIEEMLNPNFPNII